MVTWTRRGVVVVVTEEEGGVTRTRLVGGVRLGCRAGHGRWFWTRMGEMKRRLWRDGSGDLP